MWARALFGAVLAFALTVPAWSPLLHPQLDLWEMDDARNHLVRLYHFNWLLERGVLYPRWAPDMAVGYGYPVFNFYAPATYYLTAALQRLLHLDIWDGYRAAAVSVGLLGVGGAYVFVVTVWRRVALGVLAAVGVLYAPYVFQSTLLRRGAVPEALALALIPWLLLAVWGLWRAETRRQAVAWGVAAAVAGAAEILAHNLTAVLAAAAGAVWVGALCLSGPARRPLRLARVGGAGLLAAALAATFWLPAIAEGGAVQLTELTGNGGLDFRGWFVDPTGASPRHRLPENRQTRTGLIDLHLRYPHQRLSVPPKASLGQALTAALAGAGLLLALAGARARWASRRAVPGGAGDAIPAASAEASGADPALPAGASSAYGAVPATARAAGGDGAPEAGGGEIAALLGLAAVCWGLTFSFSAPVWERVPGMALLQFPWRLMGLAGIALALAGAGGMARLGAALERVLPWPAGWWASLGAAAVTLLLLGNGLGERSIPFAPSPRRTLDAATVLADEDADVVGMGTTSGREFLPRGVHLATYTAGQPRGKPVLERLYPGTDWLAGLVYPVAGDLRIESLRAEALRLGVRVTNTSDTPGRLAVHQFAFPGWRAWVDGAPAPVGVIPPIQEQQAAPGFIVVDVPPGEHVVGVVFGPTPVRLVGQGLSLLGVLVLVSLPLALSWKTRRALRPGLAVLWVVAGGAVLAGGWRSVAPAVERFAVPDVPRAATTSGRWGAPDLDRAPAGAGLVVNLAEAARRGGATVESPSGRGAGLDRFVDVSSLTVTDEDTERGHAGVSPRQWLYMHPPASVSVDVALPARRDVRFQAGLTLDPATWRAPAGDGVHFQLLVTPLSGPAGTPAPAGTPRPPTTPAAPGAQRAPGGAGAQATASATVALDQTLNPRAQTEHRRWVPVEVSLSRWAGQTVRLTLRTASRDGTAYDWSGWGNPVVVVADTGRGPLPPRSPSG